MAINDRLAYNTNKGGVLAMTYAIKGSSARQDSLPQSTRTHTPFVDGFIAKNYPDNQEKMFRKLSEYQPVGRMGKPEGRRDGGFPCNDRHHSSPAHLRCGRRHAVRSLTLTGAA